MIVGNVTSVVEYSKIVTVQQLGDRIMHNIHIFDKTDKQLGNVTSVVEIQKLSQCSN